MYVLYVHSGQIKSIGTIFYVKPNDIYIVFLKIYVRRRKRNIIQFVMCTKLVGLVLSLK